ncbi:MAG: hypothetical protein QN178_12015 [Armatimonadota bacterium]|nr:hypothetical protein [Armatimonadota bacterium]
MRGWAARLAVLRAAVLRGAVFRAAPLRAAVLRAVLAREAAFLFLGMRHPPVGISPGCLEN